MLWLLLGPPVLNCWISFARYSVLRSVNSLSPPVKILFTDRSKVVFFVDHFLFLCFVFVMLSCLLNAAMGSPAGKWLTYWRSCVLCFLCFVTLQCGVLVWTWYLIVSIPDLCLLTYFHRTNYIFETHCRSALEWDNHTIFFHLMRFIIRIYGQ